MNRLGRIAIIFCFASALFHCGSEFAILLDEDSRTAIFWTESGGAIKTIYSDGTGLRTIVSLAPRVPLDVALDMPGKKLYWTEYTGSSYQIRRAGLDGNGEELYYEKTLTVGDHGPTSITIDPDAGKIYWNQYQNPPPTGLNDIWWANLTSPVPVLDQEKWFNDLDYPYTYCISIDAINRKLYFTAGSYWDITTVFGSGSDGAVYRGELDPLTIYTQQFSGTGLTSPSIPFRGIAVDGHRGYTYYADYTASLSIQRANLDVLIPTEWVSASGFEIQKISLDLKGRKIYWTSDSPNGIYRADLDRANSNIEQFLLLTDTPTGIVIAP